MKGFKNFERMISLCQIKWNNEITLQHSFHLLYLDFVLSSNFAPLFTSYYQTSVSSIFGCSDVHEPVLSY